MRSFTVHAASLVTGLGLGVLILLSMSQTTASKDSWPPAKADIVNVFEHPGTPIGIPAGTSYSVLTVPNDRWLTVTGAFAGCDNFSTYWAEELSGNLTQKGFARREDPSDTNGSAVSEAPQRTPQEAGGPIGWTFRPGSHVVLSATQVNDRVYDYALIGYYSRN